MGLPDVGKFGQCARKPINVCVSTCRVFVCVTIQKGEWAGARDQIKDELESAKK